MTLRFISLVLSCVAYRLVLPVAYCLVLSLVFVLLSCSPTQEGGDVLLPGGYKELMQEIAEGLRINLESSVTAIDYSGDSVQVTYKDASGNDVTSMASHVIVTVPAGVLAHGYFLFV
jgi:hypothetical protein